MSVFVLALVIGLKSGFLTTFYLISFLIIKVFCALRYSQILNPMFKPRELWVGREMGEYLRRWDCVVLTVKTAELLEG